MASWSLTFGGVGRYLNCIWCVFIQPRQRDHPRTSANNTSTVVVYVHVVPYNYPVRVACWDSTPRDDQAGRTLMVSLDLLWSTGWD